MQVGQASAAQQSAAAEPVAQARPLTAAKSTAVSGAAYHDLTKRYAHHTAEMLWKDLVQDLKLHSACWASACMYKCQSIIQMQVNCVRQLIVHALVWFL